MVPISYNSARCSSALARMPCNISGPFALKPVYDRNQGYSASTQVTITVVSGSDTLGLDLVQEAKPLGLTKKGSSSGKHLFIRAVNGRSVRTNNVAYPLDALRSFGDVVGMHKLVVPTSCSFVLLTVNLVKETKLDKEL
ncbi:hypothetical protein VNO77_03321 [Canavalia gladiata]|uniref:Uncharacterized protein n=1 Tax=Canavalia gladiata TaxID=3824 RepID=A0AAN9MV58_CANGL